MMWGKCLYILSVYKLLSASTYATAYYIPVSEHSKEVLQLRACIQILVLSFSLWLCDRNIP